MSRDSKALPLSPNLRASDEKAMTCIRFGFSRNGALIYIAHLDMLRLFERALLRSGLSYATSQGFNPRPLMVFALPVGIGVAVEMDLVEMSFYGSADPAHAASMLNDSLPKDIRIVSAVISESQGKSVMALVRRAEYVFVHEGISEKAESALRAETLLVEKIAGGKRKIIDIRPLIIEATSEGPGRFKAVFSAGSKDNLRPDIFLKALVANFCFAENDALDTEIIRTRVILEHELQEATK